MIDKTIYYTIPLSTLSEFPYAKFLWFMWKIRWWFQHEAWYENILFGKSEVCLNKLPSYIMTETINHGSVRPWWRQGGRASMMISSYQCGKYHRGDKLKKILSYDRLHSTIIGDNRCQAFVLPTVDWYHYQLNTKHKIHWYLYQYIKALRNRPSCFFPFAICSPLLQPRHWGYPAKRPYLPCVSMAGRALLAGYHRHVT